MPYGGLSPIGSITNIRRSAGPGAMLPAGDDTQTVSGTMPDRNGGCGQSLNRVPFRFGRLARVPKVMAVPTSGINSRDWCWRPKIGALVEPFSQQCTLQREAALEAEFAGCGVQIVRQGPSKPPLEIPGQHRGRQSAEVFGP